MANLKITDAAAASALTGTELLPALQSGSPVKVTPAQLKTFIGDGAAAGAAAAAAQDTADDAAAAAATAATAAATAQTAANNAQATADAALPKAGGTMTGKATWTLGTVAVSTPFVDMTETWNGAGVAFDAQLVSITDTASNADSWLWRGRVGGADKAKVRKDGKGFFASLVDIASQAWSLTSGVGAQLSSGSYLGWTGTANAENAHDTKLKRGAAGVVSLEAAAAGGTLRATATTPAQITAAQNDYNPGGVSLQQRWSSDASRNVTGLSLGQVDGQVHVVTNVGAAAIVLVNESAASTAANRFTTSTGADVTLAAKEQALLGYDGTSSRWRVSKILSSAAAASSPTLDYPVNLAIAASVSGNALTVALKDAAGADPSAGSPVLIPFRSATATDGAPVIRSVQAAVSVSLSSGSTAGAVSGQPFRLWLVSADDAGTPRLGLVNCVTANGIRTLDEAALLTSQAEGGAGAADSAGVVYTAVAVAAKAMRILGYLEWDAGLVTAGTWAAAPTKVQLFGPGIKKPGDVVQTRIASTTTVATGTTTTPHDDTIPQNTEGTQFLSLDITPTAKMNRLLHFCPTLPGFSVASGAWLTIALHQDAIADALYAAGTFAHSTATAGAQLDLLHEMAAATVAQTTFKIRIGANTAGTVTFCGAAGSRFFGGVGAQVYTITELMA